jgi:hypothetical protein
MITTDDGYDEHWRAMTFSPEESAERYKQAVLFMDNFYKSDFTIAAYMPIVKDSLEKKLNMIQFAVNYLSSYPNIPVNERALMVAYAVQAAFWLGYTEGMDKTVIELPQGFYDALNEMQGEQ